MGLERYLIEHGAPTLAGLKVANLICLPESLATEEELRRCSELMSGKGLSITVLRSRRGRKLLYLFRPKQLKALLEDSGHAEFLNRNGYSELSVPAAIKRLRTHFENSEGFPHEVGLFLGYPIEDVVGFIEHCGENCKYCDLWKVYGDVDEAKRLFRRYRRCRTVYERCYQNGLSLPRLAVAM